MFLMKKIKITAIIKEFQDLNQLGKQDIELIEKAIQTVNTAYAPYSKFEVGAALQLEDGTVLTGSNQENASYPSGLCAERVALFSAGSTHPGSAIKSLAIAARTQDGQMEEPIYPCGSCRQVIIESQDRQNVPIRIILIGRKKIHVLDNARELLPMSFDKNALFGS